MGGLFQSYLKKDTKKNHDFSNLEEWVSMLGDENPEAIHHLYKRIMNPIVKLVEWNRLSEQCAEELIQDCIVIFIHKIKVGKYVYRDIDPYYYIMELAKKNINNYKRKHNKHLTLEINEEMDFVSSDDFDLDNSCRQLEYLLKQLGPNCERLIRLKYIEELKDADIIEKAYTQYTTIDSLKNKRAQCFKKLVELSQALKSSQL